MNSSDVLLASLKEMREALAAAMRVILTYGMTQEFDTELRRIGMKPGFGVRAEDIIKHFETD